MANPRIVVGRKGAGYRLAARARVEGETFLIGAVSVPAAGRPRLEDRLLEEARSIMRMAASSKGFAWTDQGFRKDAEFGVWQKILSEDDLRRLLG